jgi:GTP-binding protein EngB required for normal cell division
VDLRRYESAKFELAEILRALVATAPKGLEVIGRTASELFARLAEDRFNLLVVGRFSRGKSSLLNALLGVDRLPTGILPLTSVITAVTYGSQEKAWITPVGGGFTYDIPLAKLTEYLTEEGNPGNRRGVRIAQIELPVEMLRRGFHFVDSPGLGSAITENTRTTQAFLPQADAVMLVSGFEAPLSEEEGSILEWARRSRLPLYVVLNKQDMVTLRARAQVLEYAQHKLAGPWAGHAPRVFPLSARDALLGKQSQDAATLERSGLPVLEAELARFLLEDKAPTLITGMCARVRQLMNTCRLPAATLGSLRARLDSLEKDCSLDRQPNGGLEPPQAAHLGGEEESARITECGLCSQVNEALFNYLSQYQYELATYAQAGEQLAREGGLCAPHTRLYGSLTTDRSLCLALTPLLKRLVESLRDGSAEALLATQPECRLCALQEQIESSAIAAWLHAGGEPAQWGGICLPHLRIVARHRNAHARMRAWSQHQASAIERLVEDMQRYVLKRDGIRRGLSTQEETEAASRAVAFLAAHRVVRDDTLPYGHLTAAATRTTCHRTPGES